jgi:hypothetical protein
LLFSTSPVNIDNDASYGLIVLPKEKKKRKERKKI